ncbi:MAG: methyltransferase [Candidatus Tokpelaia sp.]|uniref:tRNA1(Val) (adenine(37)-N6)-methyltransferase n=1 Tax=Candidatus Tokpelaia sp. TaxID=2233777 RepID=UPI0012390164|nr:methyltransferase [Candidatus Tokpelaia sp.]KAA6204713.1 MAG: methyltransferase [Candidatus Tokpelaia sp.]KAA6206727.1 MAG: methyltransferase [Candidatus Tokpelaia sp.]KAA6405298.1 methyltransferase [Candidatus Tokpelaia sp.]
MAKDKAEDYSRDIFHRGRFCLIQPRRCGHRSGIDAMILAACLPRDFAGLAADFGAGSGAVGLAALARCRQARLALVENSAFMLDYTQKTLNEPLNAAFAGRVRLIAADIGLKGQARAFAGLADNMFDFVLMNPPFNDRRDRPTPDDEKARAHILREGLLEDWLRTAAVTLRPQGGLALIARPQSLNDVLAACRGRFGALQIVPVYPREEHAAIRFILRGIRGSRSALQFMPPLILHGADGHGFLPRADAVNNGRQGLFD